MSGKRVAIVFAAVVALAVAAAAWWFVPASIELDVSPEGRIIHGRVTTDLPDGARLYYEVAPDLELDDVALEDITWGQATVVGGGLEFEADLRSRSWATEHISVCVSFHMIDTEQPDNLVEVFGRNGERLAGSGIYRSDDGYQVMATCSSLERDR